MKYPCFLFPINLMICGNSDIAVQTPAAIPIAFSSMTLDDLKMMPRLNARKQLTASLRSKVIKNIDRQANSGTSSDKQKEGTPGSLTGYSTCPQINNGDDAKQGKAKN